MQSFRFKHSSNLASYSSYTLDGTGLTRRTSKTTWSCSTVSALCSLATLSSSFQTLLTAERPDTISLGTWLESWLSFALQILGFNWKTACKKSFCELKRSMLPQGKNSSKSSERTWLRIVLRKRRNGNSMIFSDRCQEREEMIQTYQTTLVTAWMISGMYVNKFHLNLKSGGGINVFIVTNPLTYMEMVNLQCQKTWL
jgi:hypothetical protein